MSAQIKDVTNKLHNLLFATGEVTKTFTHGTCPRFVLCLCLGIVAVEMASPPPNKRLVRIVPAVANKNLGEESGILVLGNNLAILVDKWVTPRLDVLLVLGMILCPGFSNALVETSIFPIAEWLIDKRVTAHGTQGVGVDRLRCSILEHHPISVSTGQLDGLGVLVDIFCLGDGPPRSRLDSTHHAQIWLELMGGLTAKNRICNNAADDGPRNNKHLTDLALR